MKLSRVGLLLLFAFGIVIAIELYSMVHLYGSRLLILLGVFLLFVLIGGGLMWRYVEPPSFGDDTKDVDDAR